MRGPGEHLDLAKHIGGDGRVAEAGADEGGMGTALGDAGTPGCQGAGPGGPVPGVQCPAELVQPPGSLLGPDAAGGCLRRDALVGGEQPLHADALGRVQPAQRGHLPVCPARGPLPQLPQRELEQDGADDGHEPEGLGGSGAVRRVGPVEAGGGRDQAPDGQAGRQPGFGPRGAAGQQHRADPGCSVQGEEQQVRPGSAQAHVVARESGQALGGDPGGDRGEPAEQQVLGSGCRRFPRVRPAGHRLPETACAASGLPENRQPGWLTSFPSARVMPGCRRAGAQAVVLALLAVCGRRPIIM